VPQATTRKTAQARTDPADIIKSAIDSLIRHGFELPALATLRRLPARTFHKISCHAGTNEWLTSRFAALAEILARPVCFLSNGKEVGKPKG